MGSENEHTIDKLIDELRINDAINAGDYEKPPKEPRLAIEKLIKIGEDAVEPLIPLLEDRTKYSCLYSVKILGEIRDHRAVKPILDALDSEDYQDNFGFQEDYDQPIIALQKIGLPSLELTLEYLNRTAEKGEEGKISDALDILSGIKDEKSFSVLVEMIDKSDNAIELLGKYGDKRAIAPLLKFLEKEEDAVPYVADSIRKLVPVQEYRKIMAPYTPKYLDKQSAKINQSLRELEWTFKYPPHFEGDDAERYNFIAQELKILKNLENLLESTLALTKYEGVITDKEYWNMWKIISKLVRRGWKLGKRNEEEKTIIDGYVPGPILTKETRSYRGLTSISRNAEYSKLETLRSTLLNWLIKQDFKITRERSSLYARKGNRNKRKGFYAAIAKDYDKNRRTWGVVSYMIWGKGWAIDEAETFKASFLQLVDNTVKQVIDKKKYEMQIIKE